LPELLLGFGSVYALEAYAMLLVILIQHGNGVAVGNAYYFAFDNDLDIVLRQDDERAQDYDCQGRGKASHRLIPFIKNAGDR
jgi:hypothetical protein